MKRSIVLAGIAAATLLAAGAAQAGNVNWSVGINLPPVTTYVSNGPDYYYPAPVYAPRRVYREPQPVYYVAPPRAYAHPHVWLPPLPPLPRLPPPPWAHGGGHHAGHWDRGQRWNHDRQGRDDRHHDRGRRGDWRGDGDRR